MANFDRVTPKYLKVDPSSSDSCASQLYFGFLCVEIHSICTDPFNKIAGQILQFNCRYKVNIICAVEIELVCSWNVSCIILSKNRMKRVGKSIYLTPIAVWKKSPALLLKRTAIEV